MSTAPFVTTKKINGSPRLLQAVETLYLWQQRAQSRRRLLELDDRLLKDVGLNRAKAEAEAAKPFWRS